MKHLAEYLCCMEQLRLAQKKMEKLLDGDGTLEKVGNDAMDDLMYACECRDAAIDRMEKDAV